MFSEPFYHRLLSKHVALFGALFSDLRIQRSSTQDFVVPIGYGPREKFLAIASQKPDKQVQAIQLPRMSFEITGVQPDPERKYGRTNRYKSNGQMPFEPAPYDINMQLNIMVKQTEDGLKIVEQILPYFVPDWTVGAQLIDGIDRVWDIPIELTGVSHTDAYESDFIQRRALIWTLDFNMKGWLQGPLQTKKVIKFITVNTYSSLDGEQPVEKLTIQPGLTANGEPTTDVSQSIDYHDIEKDDNWGLIVKIEDVE